MNDRLKKLTSSFILISALTLSGVYAQENQVSQEEVKTQNELSDPKNIPTPDASDSVDDWADSVIGKYGISSFGETDGKFFLFASQSVVIKPTDPQYGDALINAYDKAMMKLQEKYIMIRFGKTTTEKIRSLYSDRSTHAKEIDISKEFEQKNFFGKLLSLLDKQLDVAEKKLDEELIKLGVDPAELAKIPVTKKKDLFRDKFVKTTMRKASGSIAGLIPMQTTVIQDKKGKTVVGIVGVASAKTLQIAKDISLQRKSLIKGKGRDITSLIPTTNEQFIGTMGTRLVYDMDGTPAIISYGMGSYVPDSGDDYINDELKGEARDSAIANADAQIAELVNGRMNAKSERKRGEEVRKFVEREVKPGSDTIEKTVKNIIKITNRSAKSSASVRLQGISTVKNWRYTLPSGVKMVGAVRVWKYSTLDAVKSFNAGKPKTKAVKEKSNSFNQFQSTSEPVNTINDF